MIAYIGLGSNLGDRFANLQEALNHLGYIKEICITGVSPVYETVPVGGPEQPDFLNAAAEIETSLNARELLDVCLETEKKMGRVRGERWGPRIIDIDILLYGREKIETEGLTVPHPLMHEREFVLRPLADIAARAINPVAGTTIEELLHGTVSSGVKKVESLILRF